MVAEREEALLKLQGIMPMLGELKRKLEKMKKEFSRRISYYVKFDYPKSKPSVLPIQKAEELALSLVEYRNSILNFKKTFDENELPENLREVFSEVYLKLGNEEFEIKDDVVYLGGTGNSRKKSVQYITEGFDKMDYIWAADYSRSAHKTVSSYFPLIDLIGQLEKET